LIFANEELRIRGRGASAAGCTLHAST
jgi:hypothetical protein